LVCNRIKILYVIDGLNAGGKERQLVEILKYLDKNKFKIGVVTLNKSQFYTETVKKLTEYFCELDKIHNKVKPLFNIRRCFKEFKPDIVHTFDSLSSFYAYRISKKYNSIFINGSIQDAGIEKGLEYKFKRQYLKKSDLVISNSQVGLDVYKVEGKVLYNAIDMNRFKEKNNTGKEYNIITVANFSDYKDYDTFFKAALKLVKDNIVDYVYIIGSGPNEEKYKKLVQNSDDKVNSKFKFLGRKSNVEDYLSLCDVGILCSTSEFGEGISNSILEYMASGLIAVSTDIGATKEIIIDGYNGFLVNEKDFEKIYELVKYVKTDGTKIKEIKDNALSTIRNKFGYEKCINKLTGIYIDLMKESLDKYN